MQYQLDISQHNLQAHVDIEADMQEKKNGLFTFTLRINNSQIVDYNITEYIDATKYLALKSILIEELTIKI